MFILKSKYFFIIENIKDIKLNNIKRINKYNIIYRFKDKQENLDKLLIFRKNCKAKGINFYVANDIKLAVLVKADGLYISAYNQNLRLRKIRNTNLQIIGSAHNLRELHIKKLQGCAEIIYSRIFETSYPYKEGFLGVIKFNLLKKSRKENLIPLGGIRTENLNKIKMISCNSFVVLSEIKKKPAIIGRLF